MQYWLSAVPINQLRDLSNSIRPTSLSFSAEEDSLPPDFVARASLQHVEAEGGPGWCTTYYIVRDEDKKIVGSGCFKSLPREGSVEVGYGIAPSARRRGAATQAVKEFVEIAFCNGMVRVFAEVEAENQASARVLHAAGFVLVGSREDEEDGTVGIWAVKRDA